MVILSGVLILTLHSGITFKKHRNNYTIKSLELTNYEYVLLQFKLLNSSVNIIFSNGHISKTTDCFKKLALTLEVSKVRPSYQCFVLIKMSEWYIYWIWWQFYGINFKVRCAKRTRIQETNSSSMTFQVLWKSFVLLKKLISKPM